MLVWGFELGATCPQEYTGVSWAKLMLAIYDILALVTLLILIVVVGSWLGGIVFFFES